MKPFILSPGDRFFRWTVLRKNPGPNSGYECRCDCGTIRNQAASGLVRGRSKSCGCLNHPPALQRFWGMVEVLGNGCWQWEGALNPYGYGCFFSDGENLAHRWAYKHFVGPIPGGEQIDHLCRNRACVNPAHLEPVTLKENLRRGKKGNRWLKRTHCPNGHEYTPATSLIETNANGIEVRRCLTCRAGREERACDRLREKRRTEKREAA